MKFYQIDDLGFKKEYDVITEFSYKNEDYVIYTDMVNDKETGEFRILVGKEIDNKINRVERELEEEIIRVFKQEEKELMEQLRERLI